MQFVHEHLRYAVSPKQVHRTARDVGCHDDKLTTPPVVNDALVHVHAESLTRGRAIGNADEEARWHLNRDASGERYGSTSINYYVFADGEVPTSITIKTLGVDRRDVRVLAEPLVFEFHHLRSFLQQTHPVSGE